MLHTRSCLGALLSIGLLASGCADSTRLLEPEDSFPLGEADPTPTPPASDETFSGGQTGSGGQPIGFSCYRLRPGDCAEGLRSGFRESDTPLDPSASECVVARAIDPALDDTPVCRCSYTRVNYSSDTSERNEVHHTIGLTRRRALSGEATDGCEVWFDSSPASGICLSQSAAFEGCSLDAAATSCNASCSELSENHARAVERERSQVTVIGAECLSCGLDHCAGVLRVDDKCFFGEQRSLGFGYNQTQIACEGTAHELLAMQIAQSGSLQACEIVPEGPGPAACPNVTDGGCVDGGAANVPISSDAAAVPDAE